MKKKITIDGILSFFVVAAAIWTDYSLFTSGSIPMKWRICAIAFISVLALLMVVLTIKKLPDWGIWTRRVVSVLLVFALGLGSFYISKVNSFTSGITDVQDASETISVVVLNDSEIEEITNLKGKTVGMNTLADKTNSEYVKNLIDKDVKKVNYKEDNNYVDLANALLSSEIDALIITNSYINSASIEEVVPGFSAQVRIVQSWDRINSNKDALAGNSDLDLTSEPFTVLISGMDDTGSPNHNSRSDVNMLVMINPQTRMIQMVSFPRDAYIPNPALGYGNDKLTHTGNHGIENVVAALENVIGFDIDFYAKVNFTSLLEIVDALGGVTVDVPYSFTEQNSMRELDTIHIEAGEQVLNGEEALAFARHRYTEGVGDVGRTKAQQMVLSAIIKKTLVSPTKIPGLLDIMPNYMVTNVTNKQLQNFVSYQLENMGNWTMLSFTLENGYNASLSTASMGSIPLSCNVLSRADIYSLWEKYEAIYNPQNLNEFKFDLNDLTKYVPVASLQSGSNVVFSDQDLSAFYGTTTSNSDSEDTKEEENTQEIPDGTITDTPSDEIEGELPEDGENETPDSGDSGNGDNTQDSGTTNTPSTDNGESGENTSDSSGV